MAIETHFNEVVRIGVIGGSGFSALEGFHIVASLDIHTPWGSPSSPITVAKSPSGCPVAFVSRHGPQHTLLPSEVPSRANIAAFKKLGVRCVLAFSAVGSLQEQIKPRDFVVPTQIIDRTGGLRPGTFFGQGLVGHVGFGDPFDPELSQIVQDAAASIEGHLHTKSNSGEELTVVCMEGPAFSTRAESNLYRSWGADVINMSVLPEAKLAREAEIAYQMICMATDYDCWKQDEAAVTVETVVANLKANTDNAHRLITKVLETLETRADSLAASLQGTMRFACVTPPNARSKAAVEKLNYILPGYY